MSAPMISLEKTAQVTKSFAVTGFQFSHFLIVGPYAFQKNQHTFFLSRQNGKSYVGVLDHDSDSFSKVDIPFSSVNNIVSTVSDELPNN